MARSVIWLVPLLLVGCALSRSTAVPLDAPALEAEIWLAIGQSNMEVFADKVPRGADHVEVQQFGHDPQFNIPRWTSLKRAGKFSMVGLQRYCGERSEGGSPAKCDEPPDWQTIRAAQHAAAASLPRVALVDVSDFTSGDLHPIAQYPLIGRLLAEQAARFQ